MRRDTLLFLFTAVYSIPALALAGYGMWQAAKVGGRAAWGTQRAGVVLGVLWPLILLLVIGNWCWTRLSKGRGAH